MDQREIVKPGLHLYIGTTGTGKTQLAGQHAIALGIAERKGVLIVDSNGAENLAPILPLYQADMELEAALAQGKVCRVLPTGEESAETFNRLIQIVDRQGNLALFIDEVAQWGYNPLLLSLCRVWRHKKLSIFMTTQMMGRDVAQPILACNPSLYVFRVTAPATLEWLERWHKLTPEKLKPLVVGQHYRLSF